MTHLTHRELADDGSRQTGHWTEPSAAVWRARCLLALSIVNHRSTADGLSRDDATAVAGALAGLWDQER